MDQPFESDVMDDLAAETPLPSEDSYDEYDDYEAAYDEEDAYADGMDDYGDSSDGLADLDENFDAVIQDELTNGFSPQSSANALEDAIADTLTADTSDEFLRRLVQGLRQAAPSAQNGHRNKSHRRPTHRHAASGSLREPRGQQPPAARVADLATQLRREGADEAEALEAFLDLAQTDKKNTAVVPVIAGLAVRSAVPQTPKLPRSLRRRLVHSAGRAAQTLTQQQGLKALRAVPRILETVQRNAAKQQLPLQELPQTIQRITNRVAANTALVNRLSQPSHHVIRLPGQRPGRVEKPGVQRLVFDRPVEITIRYL
ncbi:MAG TPA: hypothetical protein V6D06_15285 [Trichocoleus sp.]